jgi:ribosome-binding factor A
MESVRQNKVSRLIQKEVAEILHKNILSISPGAMLSVTIVRVSPDLSFAKIYLSIFSKEEKTIVLEKVVAKTKEIRHELAGRVKKQLRKLPDLAFFIDDSMDYYEKIDQLLKS